MAHKHSWELIYSIADKKVRHCSDRSCDMYESLVEDLSETEGDPYHWVPGNIWMRPEPIYVLTGTYEEFQEVARSVFKESGIRKLIRLETMEQIGQTELPTILVWGTWYESPLANDRRLAYWLNHQAG